MTPVLAWRPDAPPRSVTTLPGEAFVWHYDRQSRRLWSHEAGADCPYCTRADDAPDMDGAA